jgi:hypothetical protein
LLITSTECADELRRVIATAAKARGWSVHWYDRERRFLDAAAALGVDDIDAFLNAMGRTIGPRGRPHTNSLRRRRWRPVACSTRLDYGFRAAA